MRALPVLVVLLAAGCAGSQSGGAPGAAPVQTPVNVPGAGASVMVTRDNAFITTSLAAAPDRVWPLVGQVYAEIGLPVDGLDMGARTATATNQRVRRLMGKGLGSYFNCAGPFGNAANRDDVFVTVRTQVVTGQGTGSTLRVAASAVARATTAANTVTDCSSNGELEKLIAQKITERLG